MPFSNRIRLPLYLKTPQFPTEANRFRLSNGESKTLSVTIRKNYTAVTDYMSQTMHQRLVVALNHDTVNIEGDRYTGGVTVDGEYEIQWPDFLDYPLGQASVKIQVTPFDMTNDNCMTCEEATQLSLVDDDAGEIEEGGVAVINVFSNDSICCFPITAEITYINTGYLDDATIDANGNVTLTVKTSVASVGSIVMATYRVTCPGGTYDEADVYASIAGTEPACEQPSDFEAVVFQDPFDNTADIEWNAPAVDPANGYEWELYEMQTPGTPVQTGISADKTVTLTGLQPSTDYGFYVRSVCGVDEYSPYTEFLFTTPVTGSSLCDNFTVTCDDGTPNASIYFYSYMDCDGVIINQVITNLDTHDHCMLSDGFSQPFYFEGDPPVSYQFTAPC